MHDDLQKRVDSLLEPWSEQLAADREPYTNHVMRVLLLCDEVSVAAIGGGTPPSQRQEFLVAGVFHDLGIWSDGTWDYLPPSIERAREHLESIDCEDLVPTVSQMIEQHHKLRSAGFSDDPVEVFRRADTIDVLLGARRFGMPRSRYREILREFPDKGFHASLVRRTIARLGEKPKSPLPMFKL